MKNKVLGVNRALTVQSELNAVWKGNITTKNEVFSSLVIFSTE